MMRPDHMPNNYHWTICIYEGRLKILYNDVISATEDFFDQWHPSTVTPMEEACRLQKRLH